MSRLVEQIHVEPFFEHSGKQFYRVCWNESLAVNWLAIDPRGVGRIGRRDSDHGDCSFQFDLRTLPEKYRAIYEGSERLAWQEARSCRHMWDNPCPCRAALIKQALAQAVDDGFDFTTVCLSEEYSV